MIEINTRLDEVLRNFTLEGEAIGIVETSELTHSNEAQGILDEIIILNDKALSQDEGPLVPDELLSRLKMGGRVSVILGEHQSNTTPIAAFLGFTQLRFVGLIRLDQSIHGVAAIARFKKADGGNPEAWPKAGFFDGKPDGDVCGFFKDWQAINSVREFLNLKPDYDTFLPSAEYFKSAQGALTTDFKGAAFFVLKNAFKSIDILTGLEAAEQGSACAFFLVDGQGAFTSSASHAAENARVIRFECDLDIISVRFAKFLLEHLLQRSGSSVSELRVTTTENEFFRQLVIIPRRFAQEAMISFIESYEVFHPFANSQSKIREQLSPGYPDYELLMRSACRLKQISIEHRWTALQQLSYDLPAPVAHCISAFFVRDDAEHRGRVAGKLLDAAIELHTLVAVSVATESFMPQAQSTAVAAILKTGKVTLGTCIDSTLATIKKSYLKERERLLEGGSYVGLSRLGHGGIYAMEGLFGDSTFLAIKEMQRVRNDEGQAHAGLGRETQSERFAEQVINAFIGYFEATRVLWATLSLNYCRSIAKDLSGSKATFNQLSGSSFLLPNKQFDVPADFKFNPGQLALMPNRSLAESDKFSPIVVTPLYFAQTPQDFGPVFTYFLNQILSEPGKKDSIIFNNYSYIDDSRKSFALDDPAIEHVRRLLSPASL